MQENTRRHAWMHYFARLGLALATLGIGIWIGAAAFGSHTTTTQVRDVAGPVTTKTVTKTVKVPVPGPTVYKIRYVPASQGPTGTVIAVFHGSGNQNTGSFAVPSSGDYIIKWSYSGNDDCSFGSCQAGNFTVQDTNNSGLSGNTPNDIATSGSGSTEDTGMSGNQSFNVQAYGSWTITVESA